MKFLIDAQLPRRLVNIFNEFGYEAIYTLDLPDGNATQKDWGLVDCISFVIMQDHNMSDVLESTYD